ncbi:MAG: HAD hydrolase family protein [Clostridia bacterium]|nr:HAD hydrolase family protein [Clostridia bacterium]
MKFDGYLICSDHDGTVAEWGELLQVNIEAIKYFQDNGGIFTVATGRRHDFVAEKYAGIIKPHVPLLSVTAQCFTILRTTRLFTRIF